MSASGWRWALRAAALGYVGLLLVCPVALVFWRTLEGGLGPVWRALVDPAAVHALWLTVLVAVVAVPLNTVFGILCALVIVRQRFRGKALLNAAVDLPFALSPVVVGLALFLVYARTGWLGSWLEPHGVQVVFALPGIVLATVFVSLPFVVGEVVPVLRAIGTEQEEVAWTLGASPLATFRRVTLPAIRAGLAYGVVLTTARALGEFGAVAVVSGNLIGRTQTLTLHVQNRFQAFDLVGAYTASATLALLALATLAAMNLVRKEKPRVDHGPRSQQALR